jgi:hypothetical protein
VANPVVLQFARGTVSTTATASATFSSAPTVGNLLIAFVQARVVGTGGGLVSPIPSGWTSELSQSLGNGNPGLSVLSRIVQAGDTVGPYSFTVAGTVGSTRPLVTLYEIDNQAAGTAWKHAITVRQFTTLRNPTFSSVEFSTTRPCLVIATYGMVTEGTAANYAADPTETYWADVLPWSSSAPATGTSNMSFSTSDYAPTTYPGGARRTFTTTVGSSALDYATTSHVTFIAIAGEDAVQDAAYVDQTVAEVTLAADAELRIDQIVSETVVSPDALVQVDALYAETVVSPDPQVNVDAVYAEIVYTAPAEANVDAIAAEVVFPYVPPPAQAQLDATFLEVVVQHPNQAGSFGLNVDTIYLEVVVPQGTPIVPPPTGNPMIPLIC